MNPVFYLLVGLALVGIWIDLMPFWKRFGATITDTINEAKKTMTDEKETEE